MRLQPTVVQNVVSYTTVIDVPNPERALKPGMTATLDIEVARADDALRVPAAALRFQPTEAVLTTLSTGSRAPAGERGKPGHGVGPEGRPDRPVEVQTGLSDIVNVAVTAGGIEEGDLDVTGMAAQAEAASGAASVCWFAADAVVPACPVQFWRRRPHQRRGTMTTASSTVRTAFEAIGRNLLRSALTSLGIIIGVAAVIVMMAIGGGARASIDSQVSSLGTNLRHRQRRARPPSAASASGPAR